MLAVSLRSRFPFFEDLDRVEGCAFAELVAAHPEGEAVRCSRRICAHAADEDFVAV